MENSSRYLQVGSEMGYQVDLSVEVVDVVVVDYVDADSVTAVAGSVLIEFDRDLKQLWRHYLYAVVADSVDSVGCLGLLV